MTNLGQMALVCKTVETVAHLCLAITLLILWSSQNFNYFALELIIIVPEKEKDDKVEICVLSIKERKNSVQCCRIFGLRGSNCKVSKFRYSRTFC